MKHIKSGVLLAGLVTVAADGLRIVDSHHVLGSTYQKVEGWGLDNGGNWGLVMQEPQQKDDKVLTYGCETGGVFRMGPLDWLCALSVKQNMNTEESGVVYVGIPMTQDGTLATSVASHVATEPAPSKFKSWDGYGLFAFFIGVALACIAWTVNQGWVFATLLLFGQFTLTLQSAWKHVLLCLFASLCTSMAFWGIFRMIFSNMTEEDDDNVDDYVDLCTENKHTREISDAFQDLGELGFVAGYIGAQTIFPKLLYKHLTDLGLADEPSNVAFNGATLVFMMLWMLGTKMRDYDRAVKRANNAQRVKYTLESPATLQIV